MIIELNGKRICLKFQAVTHLPFFQLLRIGLQPTVDFVPVTNLHKSRTRRKIRPLVPFLKARGRPKHQRRKPEKLL